MKVKVTRGSKKDARKITIRSSQLGLAGVFQTGTKIVATFKGSNGKIHDVTLTASRGGTTFYGDCPTGLRMPHTGKYGCKYYELIGKSTVVQYV